MVWPGGWGQPLSSHSVTSPLRSRLDGGQGITKFCSAGSQDEIWALEVLANGFRQRFACPPQNAFVSGASMNFIVQGVLAA